ncbi:BCN_G0010020.mRNA.1.CDS.1 [Saccharomyces cerevisiae]|nr:BCN_G0010020.mRNA.1.CDS.1 [Saccharomyces cerevisiae]CAI7071378.1 BCN_G0010020.mRNA.1.CDS.1 [Saccharomyces cerevisiae]
MSVIPPKFFKIANISIGCIDIIAALSQLTYIFTNLNVFLLAVYGLALSIPIVYLEFKVPSNLYRYASFYFSFLGRGLSYILLSLIISFGGIYNILAGMFTFILGVAFIVFHFSQFVEEPANFRAPGSSLSIGDDDIDDDDDMI